MIKYILKCKNKHEFESWFSDSKEFEKLVKKKMIECVFCKTKSVKKSIMSPSISNSNESTFSNKEIKKIKKDLVKLRKFIEKNFDYVGDNFTEEAKKMKYGEKEERPIYGEANLEQTKELIEEEISVVPLPWTPSKKSN